MITHLSGEIVELTPGSVIIDCNGIGYISTISLQTYTDLQDKNKAFVYTQQIIREDSHALYAFSNKKERTLFNLLISVNGVGPSSAMIMLSSLSVNEIITSILNEDFVTLTKIKGIGTKTSQRIVIDLKDKLSSFNTAENHNLSNKIKLDALTALEALGISKKISENIINKIINVQPEINIENLIKETLKKL